MSSIHSIVKEYWGYDTFRPLQAEIITAVLEGKDVLALLPTGGGKSICFQVPTLAKDGICLVISPLIALIKDQVENLKNFFRKIIVKRGVLHIDCTKINIFDDCYSEIIIKNDNIFYSDFISFMIKNDIDHLKF